MKKVLGWVLDYQRKQFDWKLYLSFLVFMTLCIAINYHLDFEDGYIDPYQGSPLKALWMFLFHAFPYVCVVALLIIFRKVENVFMRKKFWLYLLIGFGILGIDRSFYGVSYLQAYFSPISFYFIYTCLNWASNLITSVLPLLFIYPFLEKEDDPKIWYGMSMVKFDARPYAIMLGIAAVFIGLGSFLGEIKSYYPRFQHSGIDLFLAVNDWPRWAAVSFYEICYGSSFLSVELFFRGFLIFAFTRFLGPYVVLPMVATYCFLHFGKPLGETVSSIFGGYILGIIALNSRNIWGGIFIHLGVAWLMEFFGWLQNLE
jgi:uncharacterized membrane protein